MAKSRIFFQQNNLTALHAQGFHLRRRAAGQQPLEVGRGSRLLESRVHAPQKPPSGEQGTLLPEAHCSWYTDGAI